MSEQSEVLGLKGMLHVMFLSRGVLDHTSADYVAPIDGMGNT